MLGLYDGYIQTADVAIPSSALATTTTGGAQDSIRATTQATAQSTGLERANPSASATELSTQSAAGAEEKEDRGVSKSDIIALATGLGVGIPSLVVGAVALFIQLRSRRRRHATPAKSPADVRSNNGS